MPHFSPRMVIAAGLAGTMAVAVPMALTASGSTPNYPADKATFTSSKLAILGPSAPGTTQPVPVLTAKMRTSAPADLELSLTSECSILSSIMNTGSSNAAYATTVRLWVTVDGHPVSVVPGPTANGASSGGGNTDDGKIVFCNREFTRTTVFDDQTESIKDVEATEQANAFNWVAPNVGNGIHDIVVYAEFDNSNSGDATSHGVIDSRSLTINVTNYAVNQPTTP
jgi:hypothetical protein